MIHRARYNESNVLQQGNVPGRISVLRNCTIHDELRFGLNTSDVFSLRFLYNTDCPAMNISPTYRCMKIYISSRFITPPCSRFLFW